MKRKSAYHHQNLKEELLLAAIDLIAEVGTHAFTLREVARRAGVSHNAPYRHFRDKDDLLCAVGAQGFERLTASMHRAMSEASNAEDRFRLCGRGYVQFALRWPQHIEVMFDTAKPKRADDEYRQAGERAFETLLDCVVSLQAEGGLPSGNPETFAIIAWSCVHGFAKLAIASRLPFNQTQALQFVDLIHTTLRQGLAHLPIETSRSSDGVNVPAKIRKG